MLKWQVRSQYSPHRLKELRKPVLRIRIDFICDAKNAGLIKFGLNEGASHSIPKCKEGPEILTLRFGYVVQPVKARGD